MNFFEKILRLSQLLCMTFNFSLSLAYRIITFHKDVRVNKLLLLNLKSLIEKLGNSDDMTKTAKDSKALYNDYEQREIDEYFNKKDLCLFNNQLIEISQYEQRKKHLSYIFKEIDKILLKKTSVNLLEIGCGNCLNLVEIKRKYGVKVKISAIDQASQRIDNAKKYFKQELDSVNFNVGSITEKTIFKDNQFDLVFSMFCLEQIAYEVKNALIEMYRISSRKILMIEPVFENGNMLQRIYLTNSDHTRILLKSIYELNLPLVKNKILEFQFSPDNQSTLLLIEKVIGLRDK